MKFPSWIADQVDENEIHFIKRVGGIEAKQTKFQCIEFAESEPFGDMLILDSTIQSAEVDEYLYHEALVHPGMITHPHPKRVLILGGGEGATLREVLKYPSVETVVMVDIDQELVDFCQQKMTQWHQGSFEDPRLTLLHEDGRAYLEKNEQNFDIIIVDITDALDEGPSLALYTKEFYALCKSRLTEYGVLVIQAFELSPFIWVEHGTIRRTVQKSFEFVRSYTIFVPSFICTWGFIIATNHTDPATLPSTEISNRIADRELAGKLKAYDEVTHAGMFGLPKDLRLNLAMPGSILEDGKPIILREG